MLFEGKLRIEIFYSLYIWKFYNLLICLVLNIEKYYFIEYCFFIWICV